MNMDPGNPNWEFLAMIRDYQATIDFRPLIGNEPVEDHQITVCVRKRPLNKKENVKKEVSFVSTSLNWRLSRYRSGFDTLASILLYHYLNSPDRTSFFGEYFRVVQ